MAFNPFNLFKGNPKVLELMNKNEPLQLLLMEDAFVSEFKRSENQPLQNYMNYERYEQLIKYITIIDQQKTEDRNRSYRFPFVAAEILQVNSELTQKYLLSEVVFGEQEIEEQIQVEKQLDSESSDRSFSSIRSGSSVKSNNSKQVSETKYFHESDKENFVLRGSQDKTLDDFLAESKDISEDDFPDAKVKKTVIVKEIAKRTVKKPLQPLIFKILRYFQNKEVVHILDGYVCKVLDSLVANAFPQLMGILQKYNKVTALQKVFRHIDSNSVEEFVLNLTLKSINTDGNSFLVDLLRGHCLISMEDWRKCSMSIDNRGQLLKLYANITEKVTNKIKERVQDSKEGDARISKELEMLTTMVNSGHVSDLTDLFAEFVAEKKTDEKVILKGFLKILRNILDSFVLLRSLKKSNKISEDELTLIHEMVDSCEDIFDPLINLGLTFVFQDLLVVDTADLASYKPQHPLSMKVQFLQLMGCLTVENIYFSRRTLVDSLLYDHLFKLLNIYPNSSIFQNALLKLIIPFLNSQTNDIATINKFFQKQRLLSFIHQTVKIDYVIRYEKKQKRRACFIGHITSVCLAIEKFVCQDSEDLSRYKQSEQWQEIHECLIVEEKGVRKKPIGGLVKQTQKKPIIFFSKKDCLNNFRYFLSGNTYNDFDEFQNYDPGNSDSQDETNHEKKYLQEDRVQEFVPELSQKKYLDEDVPL